MATGAFALSNPVAPKEEREKERQTEREGEGERAGGEREGVREREREGGGERGMGERERGGRGEARARDPCGLNRRWDLKNAPAAGAAS